jgi:zinc protease
MLRADSRLGVYERRKIGADMRAMLVLCAITLLAAGPANAPPSPSAAPASVFPYPMTIETLANGMRVVLIPYESPGLIAYYTLVRVGSRNEVEPGHSGFAHLFEHMMFRGTKKFPAKEWEARLVSRGVNQNAFTWNDQTVYHFIAPTDALQTIVELEADRFQNLAYTKEVYQTETKAVLGEYNKNYSDPTEKMEEVLLDTAFAKHSYKHTTIGFLEDIKAMPERYEYGLRFFQRFYRPDNATVFIVGDFDARAALELVKQHFGAWTGKAEAQTITSEPAQNGERRKHIDWQAPTKPRITVGYHTPSLGTDVAAAAAQHVLGSYLFGQNSPLYRDLVLNRQIVQKLDSFYIDTIDPRLFYFLVTLKKDSDLAEVEKTIEAAIAEVVAGKIDNKRVDEVKSRVRYALMMRLETAGKIAEALSLLATPTGDPRAVDALYGKIASIDPKELVAFAKKYLVAKNRTVVTLVGKSPAAQPSAPATPAGAPKK